METTENNCEDFARTLDLRPENDGLFIGKISGFPVGLKFIGPEGAMLFLIQIRHWLMADAPQIKSVVYEDEVSQLLAEKKIQIEFEDRLTWLTLVETGQPLDVEVVGKLLKSVLGTLAQAGFIGDFGLCHFCQKETAPALSVSENKVAQICQTCLNERKKKLEHETAAPTGDAVPIFLMSPFASVVGAMLWAGCWYGYGLFLESFQSDTVVMPYYLLALIVAFIGVVVGAPVGWIIKQNRRRGNVSSASAAILFGTLAVIFGEIVYLACLIWKWYGVFSISVAAKVLPAYYRGSAAFSLGMKLFAGIVSVVLAYEMSKPKEAKLKL